MSYRTFEDMLVYYNCSRLDLFRKAALGQLDEDDLEHLQAQQRYDDQIGTNLLLIDALKELTRCIRIK